MATARALGADTWGWDARDDLARDQSAHRRVLPGLAGAEAQGAWGGWYCSYFHGDTERTVKNEHDWPTFERRLVAEGVAHAAPVFDGDDAIAWCEYGSPVELPNVYHRKQYDAGESTPAPWRISCFFVDRDHRRSGVAREAPDGALGLIARAGGGEVGSFPDDLIPGKKTSSSFVHNGTRAVFEQAEFSFERRIGKRKTVMRTTIRPDLAPQ